MVNASVLNQLPAATRANNVVAHLLDESGAEIFSFLFNPQSKQFSRTIKYGSPDVAYTSVQPQQYGYISGKTLKLNDLWLISHSEGKSVRPLLEKLQSLATVDIANGKTEPAVLYFAWGSEKFGPCVLADDITWTETMWLGGEPASVSLNISLREVPPPNSYSKTPVADTTPDKSTATKDSSKDTAKTQAAVNRASNSISSLSSPESKLYQLTSRQKKDGADKALSYVSSNPNKLSDSNLLAFRSENYSIQTHESGISTILDKVNSAASVIGLFDGRSFNGGADSYLQIVDNVLSVLNGLKIFKGSNAISNIDTVLGLVNNYKSRLTSGKLNPSDVVNIITKTVKGN
jgi:hypothetical protein